MSHKRENRFEKNPRAIMGVLYGLLTLALLVGAFFLVKAVRDEAKRGVERYIILRERRPDSDIPQRPGRELSELADGLEYKHYPFRADSDGFLMPSQVHQKPDLTVAFLGGSTTECMFMQEEERFPYRVGRQMETQLGLKVNSLNCGVSGNNSLHDILVLQGKVLAKKPQAVVLMECVNDLGFLVLMGSYWTPHATRGIVFDKEYGPVKTWIIRHLIGRKGLEQQAYHTDEFAAQRGQLRTLDIPALQSSYRKNLELFVYLCRLHGIKPVLMTQFNRFTENPEPNLLKQMEHIERDWGTPYAAYRNAYRAMLDTVRDVAREQKVDLIDLDELVPKTKEYLYDTVHLSAKGSALVADIVAPRLAEILKPGTGN